MIIFRTDGKKYDTTELEKFSVYEPSIWKKFQNTNDVQYLETMQLYIPEKYSDDFTKAFKDYIKQINKDDHTTTDDDPIRETRKETGTIRTY
jgi:hypothetical protein